MGTERNEIRNIACPCGKGRITVTLCSPDHDYARASQTWRDDRIECKTCEAKYTIVEQEKKLVLVSREHFEQNEADREQKREHAKQLDNLLWENLEKNEELGAVVTYLNGFKTAGAAYRCLEGMYVFRGIDDFRRKFSKHSCTKEWIRKHFHPRALAKLFVEAKITSQVLDQYFKDSAEPVVLPVLQPIGEPILDLKT